MRAPLRTRTAREASAGWNIAKTLVQTVGFWGFFLFLLPWAIVRLEDQLGLEWLRFEPLPIVGAAIFAVAGLLGLTSGIVMAAGGRGTPIPFDCPGRLVVRGPYAHVRNPMAIAGLTQGVGVGLYLGSPLVLAYTACGALLWDRVIRRWEEDDLAVRFGDRFTAYRRAVRCWIPRWTPYRAGEPATVPGGGTCHAANPGGDSAVTKECE